MTTVISVRGRKRDELEAEFPNFAYVGRSVRFTTWTQSSFWANPFSVKRYGSDAVHHFEEWLSDRLRREPGLLDRLRAELRGKILGCWCGDWESGDAVTLNCHAVVLARIADGLSEGSPSWDA